MSPTDPPGFTFERLVKSPAARVWDLWTTRDGLLRWWGPIGFTSTVTKLDVRPGGEFEIAMRATGSEQVMFLTAAGLPLESIAKGRYVDVQPQARLAWLNRVDFVPGRAPYEVGATVALTEQRSGETAMTVHCDAMHDAHWTRMAEMGWTQQIGKLMGELS